MATQVSAPCPDAQTCCRGLVACANENTAHSNGSQFFLTLGKADGLDRKHTIFGSITGESIYNLANMNDLEVGFPALRMQLPHRVRQGSRCTPWPSRVIWRWALSVLHGCDKSGHAAAASAA